MTKRRPFNRAAFLASYRAACIADGRDPATGERPGFTWPAERQQPYGRPWWCSPELWSDAGVAHSSTEREAVSALAASTRAMTGTRVATLTTLDAIELVREVMTEMAAERMVQQVLPLRELHARRGVEVVTIEGVRLEVDKKSA